MGRLMLIRIKGQDPQKVWSVYAVKSDGSFLVVMEEGQPCWVKPADAVVFAVRMTAEEEVWMQHVLGEPKHDH